MSNAEDFPSESKPVKPCQVCAKDTETKCKSCQRVYYCSRICQKKDWKNQHKWQCQRTGGQEQEDDGEEDDRFQEIPDESGIQLRVKVGPSPGRGLGVFATADIPKGEKVCYFKGVTKSDKVKVTMYKTAEGVLGIRNAGEVFAKTCTQDKDGDMCLAHPNPKKRAVRIGDAEAKEGLGVGQFVNDADRPVLQSTDFAEGSREVERYQKKSLSGSNCEVRQDFWFVSTRTVREGEELVTHYGPHYWLARTLAREERAEMRLLMYALQDQGTKPFDLRRFFEYDEATCDAFLKDLLWLPKKKWTSDSAQKTIMKLTEKINII